MSRKTYSDKNIFTKNNIPYTDEVALKVLLLLEGSEIINDEAFERIMQFAVQLMLSGIPTILASGNEESIEDIYSKSLKDIFSRLPQITNIGSSENVATLGDLKIFIQNYGINGILSTPNFGPSALVKTYEILRDLYPGAREILEPIEIYFTTTGNNENKRKFGMVMNKKEWKPLYVD